MILTRALYLLALTQRLELLYIGLKLRKHDWFMYRDSLGIGDSVRTFKCSVHSVICPLSTNISVLHSEYIYFNFYSENLRFECWGVVCVGRVYSSQMEKQYQSKYVRFRSQIGLTEKFHLNPIYPWNQNVSLSINRYRSHFTMLERAPLF